MSTRSYQEAVQNLNSLQSNAATLEAVRASGGRSSQFAIPEMLEYLDRLGYTPNDLNTLNVIHITGTKGKGSTSAFTDSILRHTRPHWKLGLYTSPHLVAVRERIRINGVPLSEELFAKYFFEVWDILQENDKRALRTTSLMPGYFRFLTLLAFHTFLECKVDATILEVGVGGTYDSTNIVPKPIVTGITALGIDHVFVLGKTLEEIAWQKGGIFKEGVPAFTVEQPQNALNVLRERAQELKSSSFNVIHRTPDISKIKLGLAGDHQVDNASLATHLALTFLNSKDSLPEPATTGQLLSEPFIRGLTGTHWPGRCQAIVDPIRKKTFWYLDGAHTTESLRCCMQWFVSPGVSLESLSQDGFKRPTRILIFNCTSGRSGDAFLGTMQATIESQLQKYDVPDIVESYFDQVIFCANVTYADGHFKGDLTTFSIPDSDLSALETQQQLAAAWSTFLPQFPSSQIHVLPSIEHAVRIVDSVKPLPDQSVQILVTGSLHLVGGLVEIAGLSECVFENP